MPTNNHPSTQSSRSSRSRDKGRCSGCFAQLFVLHRTPSRDYPAFLVTRRRTYKPCVTQHLCHHNTVERAGGLDFPSYNSQLFLPFIVRFIEQLTQTSNLRRCQPLRSSRDSRPLDPRLVHTPDSSWRLCATASSTQVGHRNSNLIKAKARRAKVSNPFIQRSEEQDTSSFRLPLASTDRSGLPRAVRPIQPWAPSILPYATCDT